MWEIASDLCPKLALALTLSVLVALSYYKLLNKSSVRRWALDTSSVLQRRQKYVGYNTTLLYTEPLHIVAGKGCLLYGADGSEFLDCVNNVAHVGHGHPKVVKAVSRQLATLNTNARYLHDNLSSHAEMLAATMPNPLQVVFMVCSGSEANDLALRIARANAPGHYHVAVMDGAYHGHTTTCIDLSPYKFMGPGGAGLPDYVHVLPCPDLYRGKNLDGRASARAAIASAHSQGGQIGAFFCESILSCGGQVILPDGYLEAVYEEMRAEGAACIADEVQVGFGRVGAHFWAFEAYKVIPDMVTLGKPIGNGFPMGAVVTTPAFARGFSQGGMEYFNTCGGCTAAGAAGIAVLQVIEEEGLQKQAAAVGGYMLQRLQNLAEDFKFVGDVRGAGMMIGLDIVENGLSKRHAPEAAKWIREALKARRVLVSTDGPFSSVIKLKPPLCFGRQQADRLLRELLPVLQSVPKELLAEPHLIAG